MAYVYTPCSSAQLEQIAEIVLNRYAQTKRNGFSTDIEWLIEHFGITIVPRRGIRVWVNGYVPKDPRFIIIDELHATHLPTYRLYLAEEFCHIALEYDLYKVVNLVGDAKPHEMSFEQYKIIENDAQFLARAILFPKQKFSENWELIYPSGIDMREKCLIQSVKELEKKFQSRYLAAAYRARDLGLMTAEECAEYFSNRVPV